MLAVDGAVGSCDGGLDVAEDDLAAMIPRLAWAAVRTTPMPYRLLKLAEVYA